MYKYLSFLFFFCTIYTFSQRTTAVRFEYKDSNLEIVLADIEDAFDVSFSYLDVTIVDKTLSIPENQFKLEQLLELIENQFSLVFVKHGARNFLIVKRKSKTKSLEDYTNLSSCPVSVELLKKVVVKSYIARGISKNKDNSFTIIPHKLSILPGLTEPDVLKTIQQLPGVKSPNETATGLHVRGGGADQNLVQWDGIKMYQSGHLFGMISGFNPNIKQKINFYNKGTNPRFGGSVASVIDIKTDSKIPTKLKLGLGVNALSLDTYINAPIVKNKLSIQLSGRRSFTDLYRSPTFVKYSQKVFQHTKPNKSNKETREVENTTNSFFYQDYNAKLNYHPSNNSYFYLSAIYIDSNLDNNIEDTDLQILSNDKLDVSNIGYSFNWKYKWNSKFSHEIKSHYSLYKLDYNNTKKDVEKSLELFNKKNRILDSGIGFETNYLINTNTTITAGYQLSGNDVQHLFSSGNEALSLVLDSKEDYINTHSFYTTYQYNRENKINLLGGFRYNFFSNRQEAGFEPRLLINLSLTKHLEATVSTEVKSQTINQIKETVISDLGLENQVWILSDNKNFPILKSKQYTAGLTYKKNRLTIDLDAYYKHLDGMTSLSLGFLNNIDPKSFHRGETYSKGIDLYIKKDINKLAIWGTYSFNTIDNRFESINDNKLFSSSSEIKNSFNISTAYRYRKFKLALGWYWYEGKPYTDAVEAYNDEGVPYWKYKEVNSMQMPNYHRLDLSAMYHFNISKKNGIKAKTGFALYNLYNKDNILSVEYHASTVPGGNLSRVERHSLQFTPNIFFRINL